MKGTTRKLLRLANKRLVQVQNNWLRGGFVLGRPFQLTLEPGNVCNLRCPLCATTHREKRMPKGMLALADAVKILDAFPWTVQLVLSNWGEPLLNQDLPAIVRAAKARDIEVRLESHLNNLDRAVAEDLMTSGLDVLVVALDGTTQEAYEAYRVGGELEQVIANVELLCEVQSDRDDSRTRLLWKFVTNTHNHLQVGDARAWAERLGMDFEVVEIWTPPGEPEWKAEDERGDDREAGGAPSKCHNLWQAVSVNFNGDVFPCCSEFSPTDRLSNALEQPFGKVWNSREYRERRTRNKGAVDCSRCHVDQDTNWAKRWMPDGESPMP